MRATQFSWVYFSFVFSLPFPLSLYLTWLFEQNLFIIVFQIQIHIIYRWSISFCFYRCWFPSRFAISFTITDDKIRGIPIMHADFFQYISQKNEVHLNACVFVLLQQLDTKCFNAFHVTFDSICPYRLYGCFVRAYSQISLYTDSQSVSQSVNSTCRRFCLYLPLCSVLIWMNRFVELS